MRQRTLTLLSLALLPAFFGISTGLGQSRSENKPGATRAANPKSGEVGKEKLPQGAKRDSVLKSYSINDLLEYKDFFEGQRLHLEGERVRLREKGIRDMEAFVENSPDSRILDKVIMRLAELYYESALEQYTTSQEQYSVQLEQFEKGALAEQPKEPHKDYSQALSLYRRILDEYPQSALRDDAQYNISYLTEDLGSRDQAVRLYEKFVEEYPDSRYLPDALFRIAEFYFNPPVNDLQRAIPIYQRVMKYEDNPKYVEALYRLGWSYYKLNNYPEAISYFTLVADDLQRARQLDPHNKMTNPGLASESIEYIGISFLEFKGVDGAADFIAALGGRDYGVDILRQIGDIYMNVKEEYDNAIHSYRLLLRLYPYTPEAPVVRAKIAEAYRALEEEEMAYANRDSLFLSYREGTPWWEKNPKDDVRSKGRSLAERALRENINLLLKRADELADTGLYAQAVQDGRKYLTAFPKDTTAAQIHWNLALTLDTKLLSRNEAFGEYINISNLYWNSRFQKLSAENAIALAQEMVTVDSIQRPAMLPLTLGEMKSVVQMDSTKARHVLKLEHKPMTPGEQKLATALDNYIKIFPHEFSTPERLAQAGALYYNKNDFTSALKYFKTLLRHFPESAEAAYAQYLTMESYFGKLDYKSCEIVAKRIKVIGHSEFMAKAEQRLAESIFLQAEVLANAEEHVRAAEEYRRVFEEVPHAGFADLALYNAGLEFDQAHEYRRAVETYATLADKFPKSPHYLSALNNMAHDYGELEDHLNAALTFERLANEEPDSARAEVNLYNASVFFVRAQDWSRAIRVNRRFVEKYPHSKDTPDLYYDIANFHLKLDELESANKVYGEYSERFPNSPRTVETFYRRGEYYEGQNNVEQARTEYEKGVAKSDDFRKREMDYNPFFAAEALFRLCELKYRHFSQIRFRLPAAAMDESKQRKKNAVIELVDGYTRVAGYGTLRLYEATYKIGASYEEFAQSWADQEIAEVSDERRIVAKKEINQTAAQLFERALSAYKSAAIALDRIARSHSESLADSSSRLDTTAARAGKVASPDTTLLVARPWIAKSKEKISKVIFDIAELNHSSMQQLLAAPLPDNMDKVSALEFRRQLLDRFVKPIVSQILIAHQRNIHQCDSLQIESAWVEQSRKRIVETNDILGREYVKLAQRALRQYGENLEEYKKLVAEADVRSVDVQDVMANLVDFNRKFAQAALETYVETLRHAQRARARTPALLETQDAMLQFAFLHARTADSLATLTEKEGRACEEKLRAGAPKIYQEALFVYEDNVLALNDGRKELLAAGFEAMRANDVRNAWSEKITLELVRSDPAKYAAELKLAIADTTVPSDTTWRAASIYVAGWTDLAAGGAAPWVPAQKVGDGVQFTGYQTERVWLLEPGPADSARVDSSAARQSPLPSAGKTVYFRKVFEIPGLPVAGQIQVIAGGAYNLFVNGEFIAQFMKHETEGSHSRGPEAAPRVHDVLDYLKAGANVIALEVQRTGNAEDALEAIVFLKSLPGWEKRQAELQAQQEQSEEASAQPREAVPRSY
ncbi:MAG: tetratricopeptide repeat protein [bacterium]